jgi:glucans biosynthesis protein C
MRKYYLDNLRWMVILILFPYHTLLMYCSISSGYMINSSTDIFFASGFQLFFSPWFMQILFAIAGIATFYSLNKRSTREYLNERVKRLLIPLVAGLIFVIPVQFYYGFLYYGYNGSFLSLWWYFITHWFDYLWNGLAVGQFWFLVYLFVISLVALPLIIKYRNREWRIPLEKLIIPKLLLLVFPLAIISYFLTLCPEKEVQFFLLFLYGYFFLSDQGVQQKLEEQRWPLFISFLLLTLFYVKLTLDDGFTVGDVYVPLSLFYSSFAGWVGTMLTNLMIWLGIMGIIGMGKRYLEFKNPITLYLSASSFPIYIFHVACINLVAYYIIGFIPHLIVLQIILIMTLSFVLTIVTIEVIRRIKITRFLFGIKG